MPARKSPVESSLAAVQRRTMRVLVTSQVLGGIGVGSGVAVIGLLAYELSGTESLSGVPSTTSTLGAALAALVIARIAVQRGRRPGLVTGYATGALGAALAIAAAILGAFPLHILAAFAFGWANASNLQARYAATDLAPPDRRSRSLSTIVWATTVGAVVGPNLTGPGGQLAEALGLPTLAGAYVFSLVSFVTAALVQLVWLRPDPLVASRSDPEALPAVLQEGALRTGMRAIQSHPRVLTAVTAISAAHATMVGVMVMTPVHMEHHGAALQLVGLTISLHIAGMYAFSPLVGWFSDRFGREPVLLAGLAQLAAAGLLAATQSPYGAALFQVGLMLLGTGWSCCLIAGSALITELLPAGDRAAAQGTSDLLMNLAGAVGGTAAGVVLALASFPALAAGSLLLLLIPCWRLLFDPDRYRRPPRGQRHPTANAPTT